MPAGKFLRGRTKPIQEFVNNTFGLDRKIKEACVGLKPSVQWALNELPRNEDKELIVDFILNYSNESDSAMPMTVNTKKLYVALCYMLQHFRLNEKPFYFCCDLFYFNVAILIASGSYILATS